MKEETGTIQQNPTYPEAGYPFRQLSGSAWPFCLNLSIILHNYLALKLLVVESNAVQCYGLQNFKSGVDESLDAGTYCK